MWRRILWRTTGYIALISLHDPLPQSKPGKRVLSFQECETVQAYWNSLTRINSLHIMSGLDMRIILSRARYTSIGHLLVSSPKQPLGCNKVVQKEHGLDDVLFIDSALTDTTTVARTCWRKS